MNKLLLNPQKIEEDLSSNWAVVAEAIQTILRREGYPNPYEALKGLTRTNQEINQESLHTFINELEIDTKIKAELKKISPSITRESNSFFLGNFPQEYPQFRRG